MQSVLFFLTIRVTASIVTTLFGAYAILPRAKPNMGDALVWSRHFCLRFIFLPVRIAAFRKVGNAETGAARLSAMLACSVYPVGRLGEDRLGIKSAFPFRSVRLGPILTRVSTVEPVATQPDSL